MADRIITTKIKNVKVGRPIRSTVGATITFGGLSDTLITLQAHDDTIIWDSDYARWVNVPSLTLIDSAVSNNSTLQSSIRELISGSGDVSYNSSTGVISLTTSQDNFDSNFNVALDAASFGGVGLAYDSGTKSLSIDSAELATYYKQDIRSYFSADGDLSYNATTGEFSFDVENVYTQANFDSDFNTTLDNAAIDGVGLTYDAENNKLSIDSAELSQYYSTNDITEGSNNLYYTTARSDSDFDVRLATKTTSDVSEGTNLYYTTTRFDSDFAAIFDSNFNIALDGAALNGNGLDYSDFDNTLSIADTLVEAGNYGGVTTSLDLRILSTGQIDSAVARPIAVVQAFTFSDSSRGQFTINTPVGDFTATMGEYVTDEARAALVAGTGVTYDSANGIISIGQAVATSSNVQFNNLTLDGDLTVNGTTTTINSTTISVNDKNIVLADSAVDSAATDGAGITVATSGASITYDHTNATWDLNRPLGRDINVLSEHSTDDVSEGSNLYYTTARANTDFDTRLATKTTGDLTEGSNLYYTRSRFDSDLASDPSVSSIRTYFSTTGDLSYDNSTGVFSFNVEDAYTQENFESDFTQAVDSISTNLIPGADITYDLGSSSRRWRDLYLSGSSINLGNLVITDSSGIFAVKDSAGSVVQIDLATNTTNDLAEGSNNLYYTTARFDSDFGDNTTSDLTEGSNLYYTDDRVNTFLGSGSATTLTTTGNVTVGGDLTVNGTTTTINSTTLSVNDKNIVLADSAADSSAADGAGITVAGANATILYDHANATWDLNRPLGRDINVLSEHSTTDLSEGSNLYYTRARFDSALGDTTSTSTIRGYFSAGGDLSYNSSTGEFSFDVENVYTKANFDSDFNYALDSAALGGTGLTYTSSTNTLSITNTGVDSGVYGSASLVPVLTINAQGQIDSAGTVSVAGVSSVTFDSANYNYTISTADGGSYLKNIHTRPTLSNIAGTYGSASAVPIVKVDQFGHVDSISTVSVAGVTNFAYDSAEGRLTISTADGGSYPTVVTLDPFTTTNLSEGSNLYYTTARFDSDFGDNTTSDLTEGSNLYYTTARADSDAKAAISVTDAGGDGSLTYNSGVITYTGPSASEVRAHFTAGTGVSISSGEVSIGQPVATTSDVTFAKITGDSANLDNIKFTTLSTPPSSTFGTMYYDSDEQKGPSITLRTLENTAPGVTLNVGQEILLYVHNLTGAQVNNGDVVYISGTAHGKHPQISLAKADVSSTAQPTGVATMDIPDGAHGWVTRYGMVRDLDTSAYTAGDVLYLSKDSDGKLTNTSVTVDEGYPVHIARVMTADASAGMILVDPFSEHFEYLRVQDRVKIDGSLQADSAALGQIEFSTSWADSHIGFTEGALWYDPHHKNLNYYTDFDHPIEIGMQVIERVYNETGSTINKGSPLYYSGNRADIAGQESPTVALANATSSTKYNVQGLAAEDIPNNSYGQIVVAGVIDGFDTSSLNAGENFFAGLTDGAVQNAPPSYPNYPMCLGWVIISDSSNGKVIINQQNHSVNSFRVQGDTHISSNLIVDGNFTVNGTQTIASTENVNIGGNIQYLNAGNTIGEDNTVFVGTGLDDAFYAGHYSGDSSSKSFFVKIDGTGTPDTFEWGFDSSVGTEATGVAITGAEQTLAAGISIDFGATTGHTIGDKWTGSATALNTDTGLFSNKNEGDAGNGYTHIGLYWDASEDEWTFVGQYDSEPSAPIDRSAPTFQYGDVRGKDFYGTTFNGALSGNATTATRLQTARNFSLTGDITASAVSFDGTGNIQLTTAYNPESIVNADINAAAAITDTKLATISTAGKVQNSATTATSSNTASAIVARDPSGNFSAGTITADFDRSANTTVAAGTYGSASLVPVLTIDASGFIDSAGTVSVAGVSSTTWDSDTAIFTINTADGGSYETRTLINSNLVNHDNTTGFVADEHIAHSGVTITAGTGLTGGGTIAASRTLNVVGGNGIIANANDIQIDSANVRGMFSGSAGVNYNSSTGAFDVDEANVIHNNLSGFVADEHIAHSGVSITAGNGLTGGGTIAASRTINVGAGTGVTVNANDIAIGQDVATSASPTFAGGTYTSNVTFQGNIQLDEFVINSQTATTATTSQTAVATFSATTYGSAEAVVTAKDGSNRHITKFLIVHNGTSASHSEYGTVLTNTSLATYDVDVSGGNVRILATPASSNSTVFNVSLTLIDA